VSLRAFESRFDFGCAAAFAHGTSPFRRMRPVGYPVCGL